MLNGMIEYANGERHWYLDDKRHRTDGPAIEYAEGDCYWFLNDREYYDEDEYWVEVALQAWGLSTNA